MLTEDNVFDIAIERHKWMLDQCSAEEALMTYIDNSNSAIAVLGPCGSGKASLFSHVFSDANRKKWLMGEGVKRSRLITKPDDYSVDSQNNEGAVQLLFDKIKDACKEFVKILEDEKRTEVRVPDPEYIRKRDEVIDDLKQAVSIEKDENGASDAIKNLVDALGKNRDNDYKYDVYIVLKGFERFILPKIDLEDQDAINLDIAIHGALNTLLYNSGLPLHLVVSTDYNVVWQSGANTQGKTLSNIGGQYVHTGSRLLVNMGQALIRMQTLDAGDCKTLLENSQKDRKDSEKITIDTERIGFNKGMEWSGGNPRLLLSYYSAFVELMKTKESFNVEKDLFPAAQKKAAECLNAWCSHLDNLEKAYLKSLLKWLELAEELTNVEAKLKDQTDPPSFFEKRKLIAREEQLKDERESLNGKMDNNVYRTAAARLCDRGILKSVKTQTKLLDSYDFPCFAIVDYLKENPVDLE